MFDSAGKVDWPLPIGRAWMPTAVIEKLDLTGGGCELVAWDKLGNPVLWMGTASRTQPAIATLRAIGSFALSVAGLDTTLQGTLPSSQTATLAEEAYRYQWDIFDAAAVPHPFAEGKLTASGRPLP